MKILFLKDNYVFGGDVKFFYNLIRPFVKSKKNKIYIICNNFDQNTNDFYRSIRNKCTFFFEKINLSKIFFYTYSDNIFIKIINKLLYIFLPIKIIYFIFKYKKIIKIVNPDLVISCNGGYPGSHKCLAIVYASRILNIPSAMVVASIPGKKNGIFYLYEYLIDFFVIKSVSIIFANSKHQCKLLHLNRNIPSKKIKLVYNGIKINKKDLKIINYKKKIINLGVVSRLDKKKNLDKLIELIFHLRKEKKKYQLTIVGTGEEEENLKKKAKEFDIIHQIKFIGFVKNKNIGKYLKNMDIFLFPSELEGLPYSVLEAINEGIPVVSANLGGLNEIFLNEKEVLSIPFITSLKLKKCVLRYVNNSNFADKLRNKAFLKLNLFLNIDKMSFLFKKYIIQEISNVKSNYKKNI